MSENGVPVINEDEMIGFILRKIDELDEIPSLTYREVKMVLEMEMQYMIENGLAYEAPETDGVRG